MSRTAACALSLSIVILSSCGGGSDGSSDQLDMPALRSFAKQFDAALESGDASHIRKPIVASNVRLASADVDWGEVPYLEPRKIFEGGPGGRVLWAIAAGYDGYEDEVHYNIIVTRSDDSSAITSYEFALREGTWHLLIVVTNAGFWGGEDYYLRGVGRQGCGDCYEVWERWEGS